MTDKVEEALDNAVDMILHMDLGNRAGFDHLIEQIQDDEDTYDDLQNDIKVSIRTALIREGVIGK